MTQRTSITRGIARGLRLLGRLTLTLAVFALAALGVQYGAAELNRRADAAPAPVAAPVIPVAASPLIIEQSYEVSRSFIGQVEPQRTVDVSVEMSGQLVELLVDEGDMVAAGELLARQDTELLDAERTRLEASREATAAQLLFAEQTVARNAELTTRGFTSQAGLDEALARQNELRARISETDAALRDVAIRRAKSDIRAPFSGRVTQRYVDGGETLASGQRVLGLVELGKPNVRIGVPLDITEEKLAEAGITVDGASYGADLVTLRPDIDPVTRTRIAVFAIEGDVALAFGQTARLTVTEDVAAEGIWIPTTSLKEGVRGQWTVLMVDPSDTVRAAVVELLHAQSERVFVRGGFPEGTKLIDAGPQRVTVGQKVAVTASNTL